MKQVKVKTYQLVSARNIFRISLIVIVLTVCAVYLWGLGVHHTFYENSIISTTVLSVAFFLFITIGLYRGVKVRDDLGRIADRYSIVDPPFSPSMDGGIPDVGDGILGAIAGIILWIVICIVFAVLLWLTVNVMFLTFLLFMSMLYWIFFRALRLVFKNSGRCKDNLWVCIKTGVMYTVLYNFWIYGVFVLTEYLKHAHG